MLVYHLTATFVWWGNDDRHAAGRNMETTVVSDERRTHTTFYKLAKSAMREVPHADRRKR
jgi:hypothetical protein